MPLQDRLYARDLDDVDANGVLHTAIVRRAGIAGDPSLVAAYADTLRT